MFRSLSLQAIVMETKVYQVDPASPDPALLKEAGVLLRSGSLVAFPTETVYGLGANALDADAVAGIFQAKGRPQDNPLIIHLSDRTQLEHYVREVPAAALSLMDKFWPGPLTLIFPRSARVPDVVTGGLDTVAVRVPAHPIARALIAAAGVPLAAPSANVSGRPSPTEAAHVLADLEGRIPLVIDGGPANIGLESTVVSLLTSPPTLLRPGGITREQLEEILGELQDHKVVGQVDAELQEVPSPGMKYRHYAPQARVILVEGPAELVTAKMNEVAAELQAKGNSVGVILTNGAIASRGIKVRNLGGSPEEVAYDLFRSFREFDQENVDVILVEGVSGAGLGLAIMNRIRKAAFETIQV